MQWFYLGCLVVIALGLVDISIKLRYILDAMKNSKDDQFYRDVAAHLRKDKKNE